MKEFQVELEAQSVWEKPPEEVRKNIQEKIKIFIGKPIWKIDVAHIIRIVQSEPYIGSVLVLRLLPHRFLIKLSARKPLLVWLNPKGHIHPVSQDGKLLPPVNPAQMPDLPILRSPKFFQQENLRKLAIQFILKLPAHGLFSRHSISEIKHLGAENSLAFILASNGKPIKVSTELKLLKVKRIESVLQYLNQKNIKWRVIDARFSQKMVVSTSKAI